MILHWAAVEQNESLCRGFGSLTYLLRKKWGDAYGEPGNSRRGPVVHYPNAGHSGTRPSKEQGTMNASDQAALQGMFEDIAGAGDLNQFDRAPDGTHVAILTKYEVKQSRNQGAFISATVTVESSDKCQAGTMFDCAWFIKCGGDRQKFENQRARYFGQAVVEGLGGSRDDEKTISKILGSFIDAKQPGRGVAVLIKVKTKYNDDGSPKKSAKGNPIKDVDYFKVDQTKGDIARRRKWLENPPIPTPVAATQQAPAPATPVTAPPIAAAPTPASDSALAALGL